MHALKSVKWVLPAICLTIVVTSTATASFAATIQQCVAEVCKGTTPAVSLGAFLALEKKDHAGLEEFYRRYERKLDQIRIAREKQVRKSLKVLGETQKVTDLIRHMSDQELMS